MKIRGQKRLWIGALVVGSGALWLNQSGFETFAGVRDAWREENRLEREVEGLQEENQGLAEEIDSLRQNGDAIERVAREQLGLAREGEIVVEIPDKK